MNDAVGSVVGYELWLANRDPSLLDELVAYNRDDCESTAELVDWIRTLPISLRRSARRPSRNRTRTRRRTCSRRTC